MRKLKNIFISGILSVCMVVTSLPVELLAQELETVQEDVQENIHSNEQQDARREIVLFTELPDEVKEQVVEVGTPVESLELPETLTALCRISNETKSEDGSTDSDKEPDSEKDDKQPDKGKEEKPEGDTGKENEYETGDTGKESEDESGDSDNKSGDDSENSDNGDGEKTEDSGKDSGGTTEGDTDEENGDASEDGVDEESRETSEVEGNTGVGNVDGAEVESGEENTDSTEDNKAIEKQETVTVTMPENYAMPNEVEEIKELSYETEVVVSENEVETEKETKIYEETVTIDGVTWKSLPEYDSDVEGEYIFTPVISDGVYTLAEDVKLPEISVTVAEAEMMLEETELPDVSGSTTPMCGVINRDATWEAGTLSAGELIIKPGVTLTIKGRVNISGTVTIKGGGTILRGSGDAYFSIEGILNGLIVGDITLNGNLVPSQYPMIFVDSHIYGLAWNAWDGKTAGGLKLFDNCVIKNCINQTSMYSSSSGEQLM